MAAGPHCSRRARPLAQGKHGPHRRTHKHARERERPITEREKTENPTARLSEKRASAPPTAWQSNCAHSDIHEPQVRLGHKNCSIYTPRSFRRSRAARSRRLLRPTVLRRGESVRGGGAVHGSPCFAFISRLRRVIVVAHSHPVFATGPCWHFFSQRHVTASLHNSEARVPFRACDWTSAAEARPKRNALIGCRSINSDYHVLLEGKLCCFNRMHRGQQMCGEGGGSGGDGNTVLSVYPSPPRLTCAVRATCSYC